MSHLPGSDAPDSLSAPLTLAETAQLALQAGATVIWIEGLPPVSPLRPYCLLETLIFVPADPAEDDRRCALASALAEYKARL